MVATHCIFVLMFTWNQNIPQSSANLIMGSFNTLEELLDADFHKLLKHKVNHEQASQLWDLFHSETVKLYVWENTVDLDGLTKISFIESKKCFDVYIEAQVLKSKYSCWRMSIVLHELMHVLQYFTPALKTAEQVKQIAEHGQLWKNTVETSIRKGRMKRDVIHRRSKIQRCLYSGSRKKCRWC